MSAVSRHVCVNTCVQCMLLELVADLYMYMCLCTIVIVHITQYEHAIDTAFYISRNVSVGCAELGLGIYLPFVWISTQAFGVGRLTERGRPGAGKKSRYGEKE